MNKIFNSLLWVIGLVAIVACSDDDGNPYAHDSYITITGSNLTFEPLASEGTISFVSEGSVTATCQATWCKPTVENGIVRVNVEQNDGIESRSVGVVLHCNGDSVLVPVLQKGVSLLFSDEALAWDNNEGKTIGCLLKTNIPVEIQTYPDWATAYIENDSLKVDIQPNTTGNFRKGVVTLKSPTGNYAVDINVVQFDFAQNIAGSYMFCYTDERGSSMSLPVTVNNDAISIPLLKLNIPFEFDKYNLAFNVRSGSYLGKPSARFDYLYLMFATEDGSYWSSYGTGMVNTAPVIIDTDGRNRADFNVTYMGRDFNTFYFRQFAEQELVDTNDNGNYMICHKPYLLKNNR